jgi:hypothetical protein
MPNAIAKMASVGTGIEEGATTSVATGRAAFFGGNSVMLIQRHE